MKSIRGFRVGRSAPVLALWLSLVVARAVAAARTQAPGKGPGKDTPPAEELWVLPKGGYAKALEDVDRQKAERDGLEVTITFYPGRWKLPEPPEGFDALVERLEAAR